MRLRAAVPAVLGLLATAAWAGADLILVDGRLLQGRSVERKDSVYLLTTNFGNVIPVPVELVQEMRLTGGDATPPTGLVYAGPKQLAGPDIGLAGRREQLAAFGRPPALFQGASWTGRWYPEDGYEGKNQSDFHPVGWAKPTIDPFWSPVPAYTSATDRTEFRPVRWHRPSIDPTWHPRNDFLPREWFAPLAKSRE